MSKIEELLETMKSDPITLDDIKEKMQINALINRIKAEDLLKKSEEEEEENKKIKLWVVILAIVGILAIGCAVGYFIYRKRKPDYFADFDEDTEDAEADDEDIFED